MYLLRLRDKFRKAKQDSFGQSSKSIIKNKNSFTHLFL